MVLERNAVQEIHCSIEGII